MLVTLLDTTDFGATSAIIWPLLPAMLTEMSNGMQAIGLMLETFRKVLSFYFGTFRHANLIEDKFWRHIIEPGLPQQIEQTFDVSEAGKVRQCRYHHLVG